MWLHKIPSEVRLTLQEYPIGLNIVCLFLITVHSRYLEIQWTLWNTSRYPYFEISDLRNWGKQLIEQPPLTEWIFNLTPKLEIYWKYCGKEEKSKEKFLLFSTIFCCLLVDLCVKTGTRFSLRDKRLFEISEFEITSRLYYQSCRTYLLHFLIKIKTSIFCPEQYSVIKFCIRP